MELGQDKVNELVKIARLRQEEQLAIDGILFSTLPEKVKVVLGYRMSRIEKPTGSEDSVYQQARRWFRSEPVRLYIKQKKENTILSDIKAEDICKEPGDEMDKEEYIRMLNKHLLIADRENNSKLVADISAKINTITKFGNGQNSSSDSTIRIYRPLTCSECPLYTAKMAEINEKIIND